MKILLTTVKVATLGTAGLLFSLLLNSHSPAQAEIVRTGPQGNTSTTDRTVEEGALIRTTTGPDGNTAVTTTTAEDGTVTRTTVGPDGREATSTHTYTVEDDTLTRESTGPAGNTRSVIRSRD